MAYIEDLAKRLCAAWLSMKLGITLQYASKRYIEEETIGEYWVSLAKKVLETIRKIALDRPLKGGGIIAPAFRRGCLGISEPVLADH